MSECEVQEGQTWEAVQAAAHHGIDNLWALMDVNRQQCDGAMDDVMTVGDIAAKFRDFGAVVAEVDAHDLIQMRAAAAIPHPGRPLIVLAHSRPTQGMESLMSRFPKLHYVRFKSEDERVYMNTAIAAELGIAPAPLEAH